ncbi:MAG TPA: DUF3426 domain-containing protein [Stellaceae bacterium]|jgi:predicted Zn finger-like uncharacterized protein|nr:DUF3426 domain-containing protein [Stellaceae bacterium]
MIVTCPACNTRYLVDPRALGDAGRVVRCANCSKTWHQTPPEDRPRSLDLAPAGVVPDFTTGPTQLPALAQRRRLPVATMVWGVLVIVILAAVIAGIAAREQLVALWPPATRLYTMVGLPVQPPGIGLELRKTTPAFTTENGVRTLVVEGEVANVSQIARNVPTLKVVLRDRDGGELQALHFDVAEQRLLPGASIPFRTSIPQPNPAATSVLVTIGEGS